MNKNIISKIQIALIILSICLLGLGFIFHADVSFFFMITGLLWILIGIYQIYAGVMTLQRVSNDDQERSNILIEKIVSGIINIIMGIFFDSIIESR